MTFPVIHRPPLVARVPVPTEPYTESTSAFGSVAAIGNFTYAVRSFAIDNGATIESIGYYTLSSKTIIVKIFRRNGQNNYTVVAEKTYAHTGSGWEDATLDTPYEIPATGTYYAGLYTIGAVNYQSNSPRSRVSGDLVGTGTMTDEANENMPNIRVTGTKPVGLPANSVAVSISGSLSVGSTLTATPGTWSGSGIGLSYQWYADGVALSGATNATYVLTASEVGKAVTVVEVATNASGAVGVEAASVGPIIPAGTTAYSESTGSSNSVTVSGQTWLNTTMAVDNDATVQWIGVYQTNADYVTVKLALRNSAGNYTIVASETFWHTGSGWEDFKLTTPVTTAASGTYYAGLYSASAFNYIGDARAYIAADATGTSGGWNETGANTSCVRVKGYKP